MSENLEMVSEWSPELTVMDWAVIKQALVAKAAEGNLKAITLIFRMAKLPAYQAACARATEWRQPVAMARPAPAPQNPPAPDDCEVGDACRDESGDAQSPAPAAAKSNPTEREAASIADRKANGATNGATFGTTNGTTNTAPTAAPFAPPGRHAPAVRLAG